MNERRLDGRFLCADLVKVAWRVGCSLDGREAFRTVEAVLEDISPLGACVQVEEMIPAGSPVSISKEAAQFFGEVSYCVYRDYGYFAGVRFSDETRWSRGKFVPEHLTDLRTLALPDPKTTGRADT
jgi:hypothetical protein